MLIHVTVPVFGMRAKLHPHTGDHGDVSENGAEFQKALFGMGRRTHPGLAN